MTWQWPLREMPCRFGVLQESPLIHHCASIAVECVASEAYCLYWYLDGLHEPALDYMVIYRGCLVISSKDLALATCEVSTRALKVFAPVHVAANEHSQHPNTSYFPVNVKAPELTCNSSF